ncbi:unnamed protein product [Cyclocybe aegerita]|uniref:WLM domain-containing protein n=1 Tax=Cyclocybe aegerita TaxID=1973307 RepID=A0A8S0WP60_CYCAE|nr:unnamed protein product [Cyclocybe aegerita]
MVHLRLNEKEINPNPHINFITALPADPQDQEDARQLLRALAAQVRPVMKAHGFVVNSFEEVRGVASIRDLQVAEMMMMVWQYEYNQVFAGRNWNNGDTIELVLRRADGTFCPIYWLIGILCHELACKQHMNHGPAFQALWSRLRVEVRQLQDRGYYGDGYWSSGRRLRDSARVGGEGIEEGDLPEYMCGGAQSQTRPTATRRRRGPRGKQREVVPSLHTGAQTAKKRKAGGRVTSKYAFVGEGATLGNDGKGTGFGKQAASKRAREERALAAERRLLALQGVSQDTKPSTSKAEASAEEDSDDDEVEFVAETDADRRKALVDSEKDPTGQQEKLSSRTSWKLFKDEFNFNEPPKASGSGSALPNDTIEISSNDDGQDGGLCDVPIASGSTYATGSSSKGKGKHKGESQASTAALTSKAKGNLGLGRMVQTEIDLRKKEALGMAPVKGGGRILSTKPPMRDPGPAKAIGESSGKSPQGAWSCLVCTL